MVFSVLVWKYLILFKIYKMLVVALQLINSDSLPLCSFTELIQGNGRFILNGLC